MAKPITSTVRLGKMRIKHIRLLNMGQLKPTEPEKEVIHSTHILQKLQVNTLIALNKEVLRIALINRVQELMEKKANNKNRH